MDRTVVGISRWKGVVVIEEIAGPFTPVLFLMLFAAPVVHIFLGIYVIQNDFSLPIIAIILYLLLRRDHPELLARRAAPAARTAWPGRRVRPTLGPPAARRATI